MSNNIRDAKSAALGAMLDAQIAMQQFQQEWMYPEIRRAQAVVERSILTQWDARAPEIAAMQAENPDVYQKATGQIDAIRARLNGTAGNTGSANKKQGGY